MNPPCNLCGSKKRTLILISKDPLTDSKEEFNLFRCDNCNLTFVSPQPTNLSKYYPDEKYGFYQQKLSKKRHHPLLKKLNRLVIRLIFGKYVWTMDGKGKKALDIGCATGQYLTELKTLGWVVKGIEPGKRAAKIGRKSGLDIYNTNLKNAKIKEKFDLITMKHVIEHLQNPVLDLKKVHSLLKKDGRLMIATPNINSWEYRLFKSKWGAFEVPRHLFLFDKSTINKLLEKTGFEVTEIKKEIYPASALIGLKNSFPNLLPILNSKTFFWIFAIIYSIITRLIGNGRMIIIAKKKTETDAYKKVFVTFASSNLKKTLKRIKQQAKKMDIYDIISINNENNLDDNFRKKFKEKLNKETRGFGYWSWKPQIILQEFKNLKDGDIIHYADTGCHLNKEGRKRLAEYFDITRHSKSGVLAFEYKSPSFDKKAKRPLPEYIWTKGDLLDYFKVRNNKRITETNQVVATTFFIRKCKTTNTLLEKWIQVYKDDFSLTDDTPSKSPNFRGFKENRHDQSVFSILCKLNKVKTISAFEHWYLSKENGNFLDHKILNQYPVWAEHDLETNRIKKVKKYILKLLPSLKQKITKLSIFLDSKLE